MSKYAYRIFDDKDGQPHTLFHAVDGTRRLKTGEWYQAKKKVVFDGSGVTAYVSGFHVLPSRQLAIKVLKDTFKKLGSRVVARVLVGDNVWRKEHSKHGVLLAEWMLVREGDWRRRYKVRRAR